MIGRNRHNLDPEAKKTSWNDDILDLSSVLTRHDIKLKLGNVTNTSCR